jgi:TolB-like protein
MSFLAELKRRNVIRMAGLYLVGAWLIVQIAETLLPIFKTPDWVLQTLVLLLALGFIPALVFSWVFELTPDGLRRDGEVKPDASVAAQTGRRMDKLILGGMVAVVLLIAADRLWPESTLTEPDSLAAPSSANVQDPAASSEGDPATTAAANSIAVLPFADLSPEGNQAWFADGISEEILNVLVGVDGLTVASRTSSFQFRNQEALGIPAIADALEVRHVLEGSVRRAGDRLRITAQLIDSQSDKHLWSETFDRTLTTDNLFDIQDEIAAAIVQAINGNLDMRMTAAAPVSHRTGNLDAYALYLRARGLYFARVELMQVVDLLGQAVELDPGFADALAMRAAVFAIAPEYGVQLAESPVRSRQIGRELAQQALEIDPGHGLAQGVLSLALDFDLTMDIGTGDYQEVIDGYERASMADPNNVDLVNWSGYSLFRLGRFERAEAEFRRCRDMEPTYAPCRANLSGAMLLLGRPEQAHAELVSAAAKGAVAPDIPLLMIMHALGMRESFYLAGSNLAGLRGWHDFDGLYDALSRPGDDHSLLRARLAASGGPDGNFQLDALLIALGDHSRRINNWTVWLPAFAEYRRSPEFSQVMKDNGILAYWQQEGFPPGCHSPTPDTVTCD